MRISFSLRFLLTLVAALTVMAFATVAMADKGAKFSDSESIVMLKALDIGEAISAQKIDPTEERGHIETLLIPKGDGIFVAADGLALGAGSRGKDIFLTNVGIPMTRDESGRYMIIANSRPTLILGTMVYKAGFPLRC